MVVMDRRPDTFNPGQYSDVPMYNIQAVSASTGVPSITLRSWERRYGIPEPKRDAKGYRLYSERDIAVTRWLKERVQQGIGISRAVNMLHILEREEAAPALEATFDFSALQSRLLQAIRNLDDALVDRTMAEALMVAPVEDVALRLVQPALEQVGSLWASGELSVTMEHFASNLLRAHLAQLARLSPQPWRAEQIVVGSAPGELHDIGALMVALFLRRRGFRVVYAGASVEPEDLIGDIRALQPAAICMSAASVDSAGTLGALYARLDGDFSGIRAFGGRIFRDHPELIERIPGMHLGDDAAAASRNLESALQDASLV
jgi:methanogenic corrinoid protein MtbC1